MLIDLTSYEKRSLYRFLVLYLGSVFFLITIIGFLFCKNSSNTLTAAKRFEMLYQARMLESKLLRAEENGSAKIDKNLFSNVDSQKYRVGFYNKDKKPIVSEIDKVPRFNEDFYGEGTHCYGIVKYPGSKLDVGYIVIQENELKAKLNQLKHKVLIFILSMFVFMSIVGYFLSKLFLKPIRERMEALDRFIEDTTHELNTPISAILMTVQTLKGVEGKKLSRLKASAKRLSVMYDTLAYSLYRENKDEKEKIDLKEFIDSRVEAIKPLADSKDITIDCDLEHLNIEMSREDMKRLIDNVLSNAIKYSEPNSKVEVSLKDKILCIKDWGIGMSKEEQANVFKRYQRFNKDKGGFGIGLSIVMTIAKENGIKVTIDSAKGEGSRFCFDLAAVALK